MSSVLWTDAKSIYHIVSPLLYIYSANTISVFRCLYLGPKSLSISDDPTAFSSFPLSPTCILQPFFQLRFFLGL